MWMKPPASRNRERDVLRSRPRAELEVAYVLLRVAGDLLDLALYQHLARNGLLTPIAHHSVPEGFADVEEKLVAFLLRVLNVLLVPHQLRDRIDHVPAIVEDRHAVGVEQRVAEPPAIDATVVCTLRAR